MSSNTQRTAAAAGNAAATGSSSSTTSILDSWATHTKSLEKARGDREASLRAASTSKHRPSSASATPQKTTMNRNNNSVSIPLLVDPTQPTTAEDDAFSSSPFGSSSKQQQRRSSLSRSANVDVTSLQLTNVAGASEEESTSGARRGGDGTAATTEASFRGKASSINSTNTVSRSGSDSMLFVGGGSIADIINRSIRASRSPENMADDIFLRASRASTNNNRKEPSPPLVCASLPSHLRPSAGTTTSWALENASNGVGEQQKGAGATMCLPRSSYASLQQRQPPPRQASVGVLAASAGVVNANNATTKRVSPWRGVERHASVGRTRGQSPSAPSALLLSPHVSSYMLQRNRSSTARNSAAMADGDDDDFRSPLPETCFTYEGHVYRSGGNDDAVDACADDDLASNISDDDCPTPVYIPERHRVGMDDEALILVDAESVGSDGPRDEEELEEAQPQRPQKKNTLQEEEPYKKKRRTGAAGAGTAATTRRTNKTAAVATKTTATKKKDVIVVDTESSDDEEEESDTEDIMSGTRHNMNKNKKMAAAANNKTSRQLSQKRQRVQQKEASPPQKTGGCRFSSSRSEKNVARRGRPIDWNATTKANAKDNKDNSKKNIPRAKPAKKRKGVASSSGKKKDTTATSAVALRRREQLQQEKKKEAQQEKKKEAQLKKARERRVERERERQKQAKAKTKASAAAVGRRKTKPCAGKR